MSCGFGAVVLVFLIIDHSLEIEIQTVNAEVLSEVDLLEEDIREGEAGLVRLRNALDDADLEIVEADGLARRITEELDEYEALIAAIEELGVSETDAVAQLQAEINQLEEKIKLLQEAAESAAGRNARDFLGDGNRQYLTGLNLGGNKIAIMLDASSSMLSETIVDIYRYRGLSPELQRRAPKWLRAVRTVEWIVANLPTNSEFQLIVFNESAQTLNKKGDDAWIKVTAAIAVDGIIERLRDFTPAGGTNLFKAITKLDDLDGAPPDNIILITDGLPTQGDKPIPKGERKVTSDERRRHLKKVQSRLGRQIPINIILFPLEGDPFAETDYWEWAQITKGSFMTPSANWP